MNEKSLRFRAEYKPSGYYLEHFWQADLGYIGQAIIGVKVPNNSHVACIQHGRVVILLHIAQEPLESKDCPLQGKTFIRQDS